MVELNEVNRMPVDRPDALYRHRAEKAEAALAALKVEHEKALASLRAKVTTEEAELHAYAQRIMLAWVEGQQRTLDPKEMIRCYEAAAGWLAMRTALVAEGATLTEYARLAREKAAAVVEAYGAKWQERAATAADRRGMNLLQEPLLADQDAVALIRVGTPSPEDAEQKIRHSEALDDGAK